MSAERPAAPLKKEEPQRAPVIKRPDGDEGVLIQRIRNAWPEIVRDVKTSDKLQYPQDAEKEGIGAIVSVPINFSGKVIGALRLYHHEVWDISERDVDSLLVLAENIGLAMTYTRVLKAVRTIRYTVDDIHDIWMLE